MVLPERELVIINPPKTAGQAVQVALSQSRHYITGRGVWRHDTAEEIYEKMPEARDWKTAILVRNPYDRLESFYHYTRRSSVNANSPIKDIICQHDTFESWVTNVRFDEMFFHSESIVEGAASKLWPMVRYARGVGMTGVNIIRMENLQQDLEMFVGAPVNIPRVNEGQYPYATWTELMRGRVYKAFREDFEVFGYESLL